MVFQLMSESHVRGVVLYVFVVAFFSPSPLQEGDSRALILCRGQTLKLLPVYVAKVSAKELEQNGEEIAKVPFTDVEAAITLCQNWKTESCKLAPDIQDESHVRIADLRAGVEGAPPNQPRASGSSASQRTHPCCVTVMCLVQELTVVRASPLIPEPGHLLAVNLCTSKFQREAKLAVQGIALLVICAVQKGQCEAK